MDDTVKQRLVGAVVLASAAVIFFPSLFDEPDDRYIGGQSQIPPAPQFTPVPIAEPVKPQGITPAPEPEAMYQLVDEPEPKVAGAVSADAGTVQSEPAEPAVEPELVKAQAPGLNDQGVLKAWVLQVASFSDQKKAEDLEARLIKAGHTAFIRPLVNSKGQQVVRVYVGPKASRSALEKTKAELDKSLKVDSLIREFKP